MIHAKKKLAGRGQRLLARIVDGLIVFVGFLLSSILGAIVSEELASFTAFVFLIAIFIVQVVLLTQHGQTIGKMALGIAIVKHKTNKNGGFVPNVLIRSWANFLLVPVPFYGLVDVLLIFREDRRCIHDLLAGTAVIQAT